MDPAARETAQLGFQVTAIREAIRQGGKTALSQDTKTIPPDAEQHCYVLTINAITASKPGLGQVVIGMSGAVFSPWNDMVKAARSYLDKLREPVKDGGIYVVSPAWPVTVGGGYEIIPCSTIYNSSSQIPVTNLKVGIQYQWTPGPNEVSLVCGSTTLASGGSFYAIASTATITGNAAGNVFTGSLQRAVSPVSVGSSRKIRGEYDLSMPRYGDGFRHSQEFGTL